MPLPADDGLVGLADALRACGADLKVVDPRQFHLTLVFLGEVPDATGDALLKLLGHESLPPPFDVRVRGVGAFPDMKRLSVLWAGLEDPEGGLSRLYVAAQRAWVALGHVGEGRDFQPHLTIARKRGERNLQAARDVLGAYRGRDFGPARIDRANLYRSTLTPQGPLYDVVGEVRL